MSSTVRVIVPPLVVELEKCLAYILEVTEYKTIAGKERYLVSCRVKCGDKTSPVFFLDVQSNEELISKLKVEVSKFKLLNMVA